MANSVGYRRCVIMVYVDLKDLQFMVRHMRLKIDLDKKNLEQGVSEKHREILQNNLSYMEPVVDRVESQLNGIRIAAK